MTGLLNNEKIDQAMTELRHALEMPFPANKVKWRQGGGGKQLAYIDARDVQQRLDHTVGINNWQCRFPMPGCCEISIKIDGEWVTKANGAGETKIEGEKGMYSDAFKRAASMWGIGRYLYAVKTNGVLPEWATPEGFQKLIDEGRIQ